MKQIWSQFWDGLDVKKKVQYGILATLVVFSLCKFFLLVNIFSNDHSNLTYEALTAQSKYNAHLVQEGRYLNRDSLSLAEVSKKVRDFSTLPTNSSSFIVDAGGDDILTNRGTCETIFGGTQERDLVNKILEDEKVPDGNMQLHGKFDNLKDPVLFWARIPHSDWTYVLIVPSDYFTQQTQYYSLFLIALSALFILLTMAIVNKILVHILAGPPCANNKCLRYPQHPKPKTETFVNIEETHYISKTDTLIKLKEITNKLDKYIKKEI